MSFAHIEKIEEVSDVREANRLIESGHELLQIVPGRTDDAWPTTLFYLGKPKAQILPSNPLRDQFIAAGAFGAPKADTGSSELISEYDPLDPKNR